jgi:hypothetical protein
MEPRVRAAFSVVLTLPIVAPSLVAGAHAPEQPL